MPLLDFDINSGFRQFPDDGNKAGDLIGALLTAAANHPACRKCGCTQYDCTRCVGRTGLPCSWAEYDLCSACAPLPETVDGYKERIERAELFVAKLSPLDLWSLALSEERGHGEYAIEATFSAWRAAKRGLLARSDHRLTVGLDESIEISIAVMAEDRVSNQRDHLEQLTRSRRHLSIAAKSSKLAPFVFLFDSIPARRPRQSRERGPLRIPFRDLMLPKTKPNQPQPQKETL